MSSRDTLFKECLAPAFADGYKDAHDWAYDKFKEYNLSADRFDDTDFTFTFDEAVENLLLAQSAYREIPSLEEFLIPRDFFWMSIFQRCLAYMAPPVSGDDADLEAMELEKAQEPVVDLVAPTPSPAKGSNAAEGAAAAAATVATCTANAFQAIQLPVGQVANTSGQVANTSGVQALVRLHLQGMQSGLP